MRSRLRRPEEAVLVPQHQRIKLRGERRRLLPKRFETQRLDRFHGLPLRLVALRGHDGGGEGGRRSWRRRELQGADRCCLWWEGGGGDFSVRSERWDGEPPLLSSAYKGRGGGADASPFQIEKSC